MKNRFPKSQSGFTLIELMVTVAMAAIVLAVGIPNFRNTIRENSYTSQANEFLGAINFARTEAVKRGTRVTMCKVKKADAKKCDASGAWNEGWVIFEDSGNAFSGEPTSYSVPDAKLLRLHGPLSTDNKLTDCTGSGTSTSCTDGGSGSPVEKYLSYIGSGTSQKADGAIQAGTFQLKPSSGAGARCIKVNAAGRVRISKGACS
jgi:type IV fimbrial biogenesis protein FimT